MKVIPFNRPIKKWMIYVEPDAIETINIKNDVVYIFTDDIERLEELKKEAIILFNQNSRKEVKEK